MKRTIVLLISILYVVSFSSISMAGECETCSGYVDWWLTTPFCNDAGGECIGETNCALCMHVMSFGSCVGSEGGSCYEDTWGYVRSMTTYTYQGPSATWTPLCYAAYLVHQDDAIYCHCKALGADCLLDDITYMAWQGPGCTTD